MQPGFGSAAARTIPFDARLAHLRAGRATMTLVFPVLRTVVGLIFVVLGILQLVGRDAYAVQFAHWGIPAPVWSVVLVAAIAVVCGAMFAFGILTRPVGLLLATLSIGALLTAGRVDGGWYLALAPLLFVATVFFAWRSGRQGGRTPARRPGVQ